MAAKVRFDPFNPDFSDPLIASLVQGGRNSSDPLLFKQNAPAFQFRHPDDLSDEARQRIQQLLAPDTPAQFISQYWDQQVWRNTQGHLLDYQREHFERDLFQTPHQALRLSISGKTAPLQSRMKRGTPRELALLYASEDISLRILGLQNYTNHPGLLALIAHLQAWSQSPVHAVAFYSAPQQMALPLHWDTENLFILQIAGSKRWELMPSDFIHPLHFQQPETYLPQVEILADQTQIYDLSAGDILYVPRGYLHRARTCSEQGSIHLSLGFLTPCYFDLLRPLFDLALFQGAHRPALRALINQPQHMAPEGLKHDLMKLIDALSPEQIQQFLERI